jgi:inosine-uridine nucleoside N-ribohydrolase
MKMNKNLEHEVKEFVMMGGTMDNIGSITPTAEFNFFADPEAAHVVFKRLENLDEVKAKLITWELCRKHHFSWVNFLNFNIFIIITNSVLNKFRCSIQLTNFNK